MKVLYYHVYLTDNPAIWSSIVMEQLKYMEDSGLLDALDTIRVTSITQRDGRITAFRDVCLGHSPKFELEFVLNPWGNDNEMLQNLEHPNTVTENYTYRKIFNDCKKQDMVVGYIHSKGITSTSRYLETLNVDHFLRYYYWRQYLNWGVLENWKACVNALETHDVAGVNYYDHPAKHFSGNFWWSKSDYIRRLPDPIANTWWKELQQKATDQWLRTASDRFRDEQWLCSLDDVKVYNHFDLKDDDNPFRKRLPKSKYSEG